MNAAESKEPGRRAAILEAAIRVFSRYGFQKTSMQDLAQAAGLSRQGLYLHFPTKEAVFQAAMQAVGEGIRAAIKAAMEREQLSVEERLLAIFEAVDGHAIDQVEASHLNELLETATLLLGPFLKELEASTIHDVARLLRSSGVAARWKERGFSAKELADHLHATSCGIKHRGANLAEYRQKMRLAIRLVCDPVA